MSAPVSRCARLGDQLGLDDEANSEIADGSDPGTCRPQVTSVGDLPASSGNALQLIPETVCSERTPPVASAASAPGKEATVYVRSERGVVLATIDD